MDALGDLKRNLQYNALFEDEIISELFSDITEFDYGRKSVNSPTAYGDTYKYFVSYDIGKYHFKYSHVCAEGTISSARFTIKKEDGEKEIILSDPMFFSDPLVKSFVGSDNGEDYIDRNKTYKEFVNFYKLSPYDPFFLFSILNSFTNSHCVTYGTTWTTGIFYLDENIDLM